MSVGLAGLDVNGMLGESVGSVLDTIDVSSLSGMLSESVLDTIARDTSGWAERVLADLDLDAVTTEDEDAFAPDGLALLAMSETPGQPATLVVAALLALVIVSTYSPLVGALIRIAYSESPHAWVAQNLLWTLATGTAAALWRAQRSDDRG